MTKHSEQDQAQEQKQPMNLHPISLAITSTHLADKMDELDDLLGQQYEELTGIREAFIAYHHTSQRIIHELLEELKEQDIKYSIEKVNLEARFKVQLEEKDA